jgi:hypothetical protein
VEVWLAGVLADGGIENPQDLARQVIVLMDGACSIMLIHRDPVYFEAAGRAAAMLVIASQRSAGNGRRPMGGSSTSGDLPRPE